MANTNILIKRSLTTGRPTSLAAGEFAYSYSSNTLFIGSPTGNGVVNVGGQYYTSTIDAATAANTASALVRRDANGMFAGRLTGIADKADQLTNARNFSISGTDITATAQSFDGTGAVVLNAALNAVPGLSAGTYGSTTSIPSVTVAANGRVIAITTNNVATDLDIFGDSGNTTINLLSDTLSLRGGQGLTSTASSIVAEGIITFDVDNTVVRANTPITLQTIDGAVEISGNLTVLGTQFITNTTSLNIADPLIYLASNNYSSDIVDIGYVGNYYDGSSQRHAGVFRHAGTKEFYIFDNYGLEPDDNVIDVANVDFRLATVNANLKSTLSTITTANVTTLNVSGNTKFDGYVLADGNKGYTFNGQTSSNIRGSGGYLRFYQDNQQKFLINNTGPYSTWTHQFKDGSAIDPSVTSGSWPSTAGLYFPTVGVLGLTGIAKITNTDNSTSTTSGALIVSGGVGIAGNTYIGGELNVMSANTTLNRLLLSNQLTVPYGGTGQTSFTSGQIIIGSGTNGLTQISNVTYQTGQTFGSASRVATFETDVYGRVVTVSNTAIAIDASAITSGTLGVTRGGTGQSSFTAKGIIYGDGTDAIRVTGAAGTSDQTWSNQVLTTTDAGVPVWTTALDGGQF
jgi:hypothetical protein